MLADAVLRTLTHVWKTLEPMQLQIAVIGGVAASMWRHVRATRDVDLLTYLGDTAENAVVQKLLDADFRTQNDPVVRSIGDLKLLQLEYEPTESFVAVRVDLLITDSQFHRQAIERSTTVTLPTVDFEVRVLACEDLILLKLLAGRIIDRADAAALLRINRLSLDLDYLRQWSSNLALGNEFATVFDEAFPKPNDA